MVQACAKSTQLKHLQENIYHNLMLAMLKNNAWNFQWNNKHSQLFETNHDINKVKKFIVKSNMTCKSLCLSLTSLFFHYTHETFPLLPTPTNKANTSSEQNMSEKLR